MIGTKRKEKSCLRMIALQHFDKAGNALARSAIGVHMNLKGKFIHERDLGFRKSAGQILADSFILFSESCF